MEETNTTPSPEELELLQQIHKVLTDLYALHFWTVVIAASIAILLLMWFTLKPYITFF